MSATPPARWSTASIALHWAAAVLVIGQLAGGWFMTHATLGAAAKFDLYQWHKSFGFVILVTLVLRIAARALWRAPAPSPTMPTWQRHAAATTQVALLALMAVSVLSGWLAASSAIVAIPTRVFDLFVVPGYGGPDPVLFERASLVHLVASRAMMALVVLHVAAALKHRFLDHDDVLARMLPARPK